MLSHWKPVNKIIFPWSNTLNNIFSNSAVPSFDGDIIYILSDYSGDIKDSDYNIISILFIDLKNSAEWFFNQNKIRKESLLSARKMSFKNLNDRIRQQALIPFLKNANNLSGICFSFAIKKNIKNLLLTDKIFDLFKNDALFNAKWNNKDLEKMLRVTHFISFILGGLARPNQNIYWISDEDNIFANNDRTRDLSRIVSAFTSYYIDFNLGELGVGTTQIDEGDFIEEDLSAVPDLIAGALSESITTLANNYKEHIPPKIIFKYDGEFSNKTDMILSWLFNNDYKLKKLVILFDKYISNEYSVSKFEMLE
jgi:hypothetical protein